MPSPGSLSHLPRRGVPRTSWSLARSSNNEFLLVSRKGHGPATSSGRRHDSSPSVALAAKRRFISSEAVTPHRHNHRRRSQSLSFSTPIPATPSPLSNTSTTTTNNISPTSNNNVNNNSNNNVAIQQTSSHSRPLHSSSSYSSPTLASEPSTLPVPSAPIPSTPHNPRHIHPSLATPVRSGWMAPLSPLHALPTGHILRSLMTATISSSPSLLPPSLAAMSVLANSSSPLLNPDQNPLLRWGLKSTFYNQFCAGENGVEVTATTRRLRRLGFSGVILNYAREIILPKTGGVPTVAREDYAKCIAEEIIPWAIGQIETVRLAQEGDFVALKFSGAGRLALAALARREAPPPELSSALDAICSFAASRGIRLMFDAEQNSLQDGIDDWTMMYMRRYNGEANKAIIYNTYQCYLKSAPTKLSSHLEMAQKEGFPLGVKLVRGAYLGYDPRELMWDTKTETDICFDGIAAGLLSRQWGGMVNGTGDFPEVGLCLATHNAESVRQANERAGSKTDLTIAQLQGMADEVSCELLNGNENKAEKSKAYKYITWGTTGECMKYLLRRAQENQDAMQRTVVTRDAMKAELASRVKGMFGWA